MADIILLKGVSHTAMPLLAPREPAVAFDPMTGDAKLWIGTTVGNEMVGGGTSGNISDLTVINVKAASYGAVGDGVHDDTAALQAAFDYADAKSAVGVLAPYQRLRVIIPRGVYRLTAPLVIARAGGIYAGYDVRGDGTSPQNQPLEGGTVLVQTGTAQDAVIQVGEGGFYDNRLSDMTLVMAADTRYGLHFTSTQSSRCLMSRMTIGNASLSVHGTAIKQEHDGGEQHGEQHVCDDVQAVNVDVGWDLTSGQAFGWNLRDCGALINNVPDNAAIRIGKGDNGGQQVLITNFSGTAQTGSSPNTFLEVDSADGSITVVGTRYEACDTVLRLAGGSWGMCGQVTISDSHFDGMAAQDFVIAGGGTNAAWHVDMVRNKFDCRYTLSHPAPTVPFAVQTFSGHSGAQGDLSRYTWTGCRFGDWLTINLGIKPVSAAAYDGTVLTDCWQRTTSASTPTYVPVTN